MLFALAEPLSALGLVVAFLIGLLVRAGAQSFLVTRLIGGCPVPVVPRGERHAERLGMSPRTGAQTPAAGPARRLLDPFGAVAAALGGTGWGRSAPIVAPVVGTRWAITRRLAVHLAGPVLPVLAGQVVLAGFAALWPRLPGNALYRPSDVLRGIPGPGAQQLLLSTGVGLVCFGVVAIIPVPPCDGAGVLWLLWRRPGPHAVRIWHWLAERNVGVVVLLVAMVPLGARGALAYPVLDAVATPLVRPW